MPTSVRSDSSTSARSRALVRLALLVLVLVAAWVIARQLGWLEYADRSQIGALVERIRGLPLAAPIFVLAYAAAATLGLPGTPLTLAGGAIFGFAGGTVLNWMGATLGATGAFFLARMLGRDSVRALLGRNAAALDRVVGSGAFGTLVRLRLIPIVPFNALNFGSGLAGVRPATYVASTALGIIPGTAVYTYFADALLAGVEGAREQAFQQVLVAGVLLVLLSLVPAIARRFGWIATVALATLAAPATGAAQGIDHAPWDAMLGAHVTDGLVDYDAFARDPRFARYLETLDRTSLAGATRPERLAYWINVYNAYTIALINDRRERDSIRNINRRFGITWRSPWAEPIVRAAGRVLTLDDVEHRIIRPEFGDPRIHAALVCAAIGCPSLRSEAYVASTLDAQLDNQARHFLAQHEKNRVDVAAGVVFGSPIFTWYREDFGGSLAGVGAFWARYLPPGPERELVASGRFRWVDTEYDWSLNLRSPARRGAAPPLQPPR
ncbi:MAG: DUF547 domain-containing protein [Gemmatimonadaceae bacterium]